MGRTLQAEERACAEMGGSSMVDGHCSQCGDSKGQEWYEVRVEREAGLGPNRTVNTIGGDFDILYYKSPLDNVLWCVCVCVY